MSFPSSLKGRSVMTGVASAAVLSVMLAAAPAFAQAPAGQAPAQPAPEQAAPAAQAPAQPAPAPAPTQAAPPPAVPAPALLTFPAGAKYAFVNIQRIAGESAEGKVSTARVQALNQQKVNELNEMNKALQAVQQKLEAGASVLSVTAAAQLQKDIERRQIDIQRFTEDAQQDVTTLQQQLQADFEQKLTPILAQIGQEKGLHFMFSVQDAGVVWGDPSLDITTEIITKFNAASPALPAPQRPAATAPRPAAPAAPRPAVPAAPRPPAPTVPAPAPRPQ